MAQNGLMPSAASPAAKVAACCSAMPTSNVRLGKRRPNLSMPVPPGMAAVMATTERSVAAMSISESAKTEVYEGVLAGAVSFLPVATSNFGTPWYLSDAASAGG